MISSFDVKQWAQTCGADLCGIASVDRFEAAPEGFHPYDLFPDTKSVISIACRLPESTLYIKNSIPYSVVENIALAKVQQIAYALSIKLEDHGAKAIMVPSVPYDYWDEDTMVGKGLLSLKHVAYYAGLGYIGKNSLFCTSEFGTMIKLGAILTDAVLDADAICEGTFCSEACELCVKSCPVGAIGDEGINQKKCRTNSEVLNKRGVELTVCYQCRMVCPNRAGIRKGSKSNKSVVTV